MNNQRLQKKYKKHYNNGIKIRSKCYLAVLCSFFFLFSHCWCFERFNMVQNLQTDMQVCIMSLCISYWYFLCVCPFFPVLLAVLCFFYLFFFCCKASLYEYFPSVNSLDVIIVFFCHKTCQNCSSFGRRPEASSRTIKNPFACTSHSAVKSFTNQKDFKQTQQQRQRNVRTCALRLCMRF